MKKSTKRKDYNLKVLEVKQNQQLIEFLGYNKHERPYFKVRCNYCNHEYESTYYNFIDKRRVGNSCKKCSNEQNKDYKTLSLNESQVGIVFSNYKSKSKMKKWEFELSRDVFRELINSSCHYCGISPKNIRKDSIKEKRFIDMAAYTNGIDRIDSTKGYIENNVVSCCEDCNKAKRNLPYTQFLELIESIYNHRIKEN